MRRLVHGSFSPSNESLLLTCFRRYQPLDHLQFLSEELFETVSKLDILVEQHLLTGNVVMWLVGITRSAGAQTKA